MGEISQRLLKAIVASGYSYGELSKLTQIPKSALQRYASGTTDKIPIDRLQTIANAVGVSAESLMGWEEEKTDKVAEFFRGLPKEKLVGILYALGAPEDVIREAEGRK